MVDAVKVSVPHVRYKDQKDAFDNRTYKTDNKDWPPLANTFIDEPRTLYRIGEPLPEITHPITQLSLSREFSLEPIAPIGLQLHGGRGSPQLESIES